MLTGEIVPCHEQSLHSCVVTQALAVAVRETSEPAKRHSHGQIKSFDKARAYLVLIAVAETSGSLYCGVTSDERLLPEKIDSIDFGRMWGDDSL